MNKWKQFFLFYFWIILLIPFISTLKKNNSIALSTTKPITFWKLCICHAYDPVRWQRRDMAIVPVSHRYMDGCNPLQSLPDFLSYVSVRPPVPPVFSALHCGPNQWNLELQNISYFIAFFITYGVFPITWKQWFKISSLVRLSISMTRSLPSSVSMWNSMNIMNSMNQNASQHTYYRNIVWTAMVSYFEM